MAFQTLILYFAVFLHSVYAGSVTGRLPVCIVGAGPTGLTIAHGLEAKGYKTVIFDRQPEVGGKCQAYYDGPNKSIYHPLGALIFINGTYVNTVPLIDAAGVPLTPGISRMHGWEYWQYGPQNPSKGISELPDTTPQQAALLQSEYEQYSKFWTENIQPLYTSVRYVNGIPDNLTVPIADWLSANGYIGLPAIMEGAMITYGYGDIKTTPAIYMLQYFTPEILGAFSLGNPQSYIVDFHAVFVHYSRSVKGPIHVNAPVTKIDRSRANPVVTYATSRSRKTQKCSDVVLAFSPSAENLAVIDMPLSANETEVFSKIDTTAYWSSAVTTKIDYHKFYRQSPAEPLGAPVGFLRYFNESPIATGYSWATDGSTLPDSDVKKLLVDTITQVQTGVNISEPLVTESDVKALDRWTDYFPRFNTSDLSSGIYTKYNALQGYNHTYYASAVSSFELVENAIRVGQDLVASFF